MRVLSTGRISAFVLLAFLANVATAQTTGSIKGTVESGGSPLPGVGVEATSPTLQGTRTATSDGEGRFTLSLLPPGTYTVTATLSGFGKQKQTVTLALNAAASVRFDLLPSQTAEVTVRADAVSIDPESTTLGRNLEASTFQALPTGRNYADVVQLNSGINTDGSDSRNTAITVYGATGLENAYLVDGVNTTGVEFGNQGKVLNFEFVQEVEFKSGGYEAEYGHAVGGILNVVTKSGGNEYHGDAFGYLNRDSLQADNKHEAEITSQGIPVGFRKSDFGLDLGGYLMKDKLWFFGAYDRVSNTQDTRVAQGPDTGLLTNLKTTSDLYSGKLTWKASENHTVVGTVFGDPTTDDGAVADPIGPPTTYQGTNTVGGTDFSFRYEGILGKSWLLTGQIGRHREDVSLLPGPGGDVIRNEDTTGDFLTATGGFGNNGQFDKKTFTRTDYRLDATRLLGNHEIKGGFEFERIKADVTRSFSGGQLVQLYAPFEDDELQRPVYSHIFFASTDSTLDNPVSAPLVAKPSHDVVSAFLQDSAKLLPNLTVNVGVRYERQKIRGLNDTTFIDFHRFSPRFGITWDPMKDGTTKVYASYGQFVEAVPLDMNIRSLNGERDATIINFDPVSLLPDPTYCTQDNGCDIKGTAVNDIDPDLKPQYQEEIILGAEKQVGVWTFGARGIYRSLKTVLEDTYLQSDSNYAFINPGYSRTACLDGVCQDVPDYPKGSRFFRGVELTAQKRLSDRWLLYASYLYSKLEGNYDGGFREIGGFNAKDPNITDDFDYPEFTENAFGRLTIDRPHQFKAQAAYVFPFGLTTSLSGYYQSGTPLSKVGWWNGYGGPELFLAPRGSEGRSPSLWELDTHFDYALKLEPVTVHVLLDVFNLLNRQEVTQVDQVWAFDEADNSSPTPTNSHYGQANAWQSPRTLRIGLRVSY